MSIRERHWFRVTVPRATHHQLFHHKQQTRARDVTKDSSPPPHTFADMPLCCGHGNFKGAKDVEERRLTAPPIAPPIPYFLSMLMPISKIFFQLKLQRHGQSDQTQSSTRCLLLTSRSSAKSCRSCTEWKREQMEEGGNKSLRSACSGRSP